LVAVPVIGFILATSAVLLAIAFLLWRRAKALVLGGEVVYSDDGANDEILVLAVLALCQRVRGVLPALRFDDQPDLGDISQSRSGPLPYVFSGRLVSNPSMVPRSAMACSN
jgi:hypothetical protein